uniref:hypothetical protein n=1 Tax=Ruminobacter amylophilus TaxID=867 RepID=UPI00386E51F9
NSSPLKFADGLMIMQLCNRVNNTDCRYAYFSATGKENIISTISSTLPITTLKPVFLKTMGSRMYALISDVIFDKLFKTS